MDDLVDLDTCLLHRMGIPLDLVGLEVHGDQGGSCKHKLEIVEHVEVGSVQVADETGNFGSWGGHRMGSAVVRRIRDIAGIQQARVHNLAVEVGIWYLRLSVLDQPVNEVHDHLALALPPWGS